MKANERGLDMVKANVYAKRGSAFVALFFSLSCDATMRRPAQRVATIESVPRTPSSVTSPEAIAESVPDTMTTQDPYEETPINKPVDVPDAGPPSAALVTVIHYAELRGRVDTHKGKRLTIDPLVITSATLPVPGYTADLWIEATEEDRTSDWRHFAAVKVATSLQFGMPMAVDILDDEMADNSDKPVRPTLPPGSKVRIQWEW